MVFIRVYPDQEFAVFRQHFYAYKWEGMSVGDKNKVATSFPSIKVPKSSDSYYINPCGNMAGYHAHKGAWDQQNMTEMCGGVTGGPFFIFDKTNMTTNPPHLGQVFAVSAFTKFTAHTAEVMTKLNEIWFGVPGTTDTFPSNGYDLQTIISYSDKGFYEGIQEWGSRLLTRHGKTLNRRETDDTVNYLGYWTDAGAYYYYNTEPGKNYEETMLDVYNEIRHGDTPVPFRSWNYDSWWYYKCNDNGGPGHMSHGAVKNWTAMPQVFPHGMDSLYQQTS